MKNIKHLLVAVIVLTFVVVPVVTFGQNGQIPPSSSNIPKTTQSTSERGPLSNPFNCGGTGGDCTFMALITAILNNVIMPIVVVAVIVYIIYAGFTYVTAQGNPAKVAAAHQRLLWGLVGAGVILAAAGISTVVKNTVESLLKF